MKNYESGRFNVANAYGVPIGRIDGDEFIRDHQARHLYRIDGDEVYDMSGKFIGSIDDGVLRVGNKIFLMITEE